MATDPKQPSLSFASPMPSDANATVPVLEAQAELPRAGTPIGVHVVRVRPDEPAIDKTFDYLVPPAMSEQIRVGTVVRIALHGRRVGGVGGGRLQKFSILPTGPHGDGRAGPQRCFARPRLHRSFEVSLERLVGYLRRSSLRRKKCTSWQGKR